MLAPHSLSTQQKAGEREDKVFDLEYASQKQIKSVFQTVCPLVKRDGRDLGNPVV